MSEAKLRAPSSNLEETMADLRLGGGEGESIPLAMAKRPGYGNVAVGRPIDV